MQKKRVYTLDASIFGKGIGPDQVLTVGFATDDSLEEYLNIQFQEELDDQERELGMSRYYLDSSHLGGMYKCINGVFVTADSLLISLNDAGRLQFGCDELKINLFIPIEQKLMVIDSIKEIFENETGVSLKIP